LPAKSISASLVFTIEKTFFPPSGKNLPALIYFVNGVGCYCCTEAEDLIRRCLSIDQSHRPSLSEVLDHPWMQRSRTVVIADEDSDVEASSRS